jgi:hypothetical protein
MPFRVLLYLQRIGLPTVLALAAASFLIAADSPVAILRPVIWWSATLILVAGFVWVGSMLLTGGLRLRCPFCGAVCPAGELKRGTIWLDCDICGYIRNGGILGLQIVRGDESDDAST